MNESLLRQLYPSVSGKDIRSSLKKLGIKPGDTVFLHVSVARVGRIIGGVTTLINAVRHSVGREGTWGLCADGDIFSGFSKRQRSLVRLEDHAHAVIWGGKLAAKLSRLCKIGVRRLSETLYRQNARIVLVGVDLHSARIFCHEAKDVPFSSDLNRLYRLFDSKTGRIVQELAGSFQLTETTLGTAVCRSFEMAPMVDFCDRLRSSDPDFLKPQDGLLEAMPRMSQESAFDVSEFIRSLHGKYRTLVSDGFNESLRAIRDFVPLDYHYFKTGEKIWTWRVPPKWTLRAGYVMNLKRRKKIVDIKDCPLHVPSYSASVDRTVSHEELMDHLSYRKELPNAIPYTWKFFNRDWGFSVRARDLPLFDSERYRVKIDSRFEDGHMVVGSCTLLGESRQTVVIPVHLDHPHQSNDNLSGCAAAISLIQRLQRWPRHRFTYRFLFLPETVGSIAYLSRHEQDIPNFKYGIVFDSIGTSGPLTLTRPKNPSRLCDYALAALGKRRFKQNDFFDDDYLISANDERVLQSPAVDIPSIHLTRSPFKEYHTDQDCPAIIKKEKIEEVVDIVFEIFRFIERDGIPFQTYKGILCLSEQGLWDKKWRAKDYISIEKILHLFSSGRSIFEIAHKTGASFDWVCDFIGRLKNKGLIEVRPL